MAYSCADFVEDISGLFPEQQPDGDGDWEGKVLVKLFENIAAEVDRLRKVEAITPDTSDIPEQGEAFFKNAKLVKPA